VRTLWSVNVSRKTNGFQTKNLKRREKKRFKSTTSFFFFFIRYLVPIKRVFIRQLERSRYRERCRRSFASPSVEDCEFANESYPPPNERERERER
jgi:hypothetical protein